MDVLAGMDTKISKELARLITQFAADQEAAKQLRRLPMFGVPDDTEGVFQHLLDKLNHAARDQA